MENPAPSSAFQSFANVAPVMLLLRDGNGECTFANEHWLAFTGRTEADEVGMGWLTAVHPADRESCVATFRAAARNGIPYGNEYRARRHDGVYRWLLSRGEPIDERDAATYGRASFIGIVVDITERHRHEAAMSALARGSVALSSSLDPEVVARCLATISVPAFADACIVALEGETEGAPARLLAEHYRDPIKKRRASAIQRRWRDPPGWTTQISDVLLRGESILIDDFPAFAGAYIHDPRHLEALADFGARSIVISPLRARDRTFGVIVAIAFDDRSFDAQDRAMCDDLARRGALSFDNAVLYAEARTREEELQRATSARDDFFGMVSHELRTPLTVLAGGARLLVGHSEALGPSVLTELGSDLLLHADRLQWTVENLLALAWAGATPHLLTTPVDVGEIVRATVDRIRIEAPGRTFNLAMDGEGTPAAAINTHVEQVLNNLLSNADRFSPGGAPIDVEVSFVPGTRVTISDRGPGVPDEDLLVMFDRFYRSPRTSIVPGAGLGLSVCKALIESMGGAIGARNRDGGGLEIGFSLADYRPPRLATAEGPTGATAIPGRED